MAFQTIQARHANKHLDKISNLRCFSLENHFSGKLVDNVEKCLDFALNRLGDKLQIDKATGRGKIRSHSNCWYTFDYKV